MQLQRKERHFYTPSANVDSNLHVQFKFKGRQKQFSRPSATSGEKFHKRLTKRPTLDIVSGLSFTRLLVYLHHTHWFVLRSEFSTCWRGLLCPVSMVKMCPPMCVLSPTIKESLTAPRPGQPLTTTTEHTVQHSVCRTASVTKNQKMWSPEAAL